jgi:hypothetical protein
MAFADSYWSIFHLDYNLRRLDTTRAHQRGRARDRRDLRR